MKTVPECTRGDDVEGIAHEANHFLCIEWNRFAVHKRVVGHRQPNKLLVTDVGLASLALHCIEERVVDHLV